MNGLAETRLGRAFLCYWTISHIFCVSLSTVLCLCLTCTSLIMSRGLKLWNVTQLYDLLLCACHGRDANVALYCTVVSFNKGRVVLIRHSMRDNCIEERPYTGRVNNIRLHCCPRTDVHVYSNPVGYSTPLDECTHIHIAVGSLVLVLCGFARYIS